MARGGRDCEAIRTSIHRERALTILRTSVARQDVIEGVNLDSTNVITLHTKGDGCDLPAKPDVLGSLLPDK